MTPKKRDPHFKHERTRRHGDERADAYREKKKYKRPTRCPHCHALFINGRWTWEEISEETVESLCPACRRIEDHLPAGIVEVRGDFYTHHRKEMMHLIKNLERVESNEHPLERIMEIDKEDGKLMVSTTGVHLPRRIGNALKDAYQGELDLSFDADDFVRVTWNRN